MTGVGMVLGTPAYMPPEQALGRREDVDAQSDLWAVGATLFVALSGESVHDGGDAKAKLIATARTAARPLREAAPEVPRAVAAGDRSRARVPQARALARRRGDARGAALGAHVARGPSEPAGRRERAAPELEKIPRAGADASHGRRRAHRDAAPSPGHSTRSRSRRSRRISSRARRRSRCATRRDRPASFRRRWGRCSRSRTSRCSRCGARRTDARSRLRPSAFRRRATIRATRRSSSAHATESRRAMRTRCRATTRRA